MAIFSKPIRWPSRRTSILVLAVVLVLRSRLTEIPKETLAKLRVVVNRKRLSQEELLRVLQEVYVKEDDGSKTLLVPYREEVSRVRFSNTVCTA